MAAVSVTRSELYSCNSATHTEIQNGVAQKGKASNFFNQSTFAYSQHISVRTCIRSAETQLLTGRFTAEGDRANLMRHLPFLSLSELRNKGPYVKAVLQKNVTISHLHASPNAYIIRKATGNVQNYIRDSLIGEILGR